MAYKLPRRSNPIECLHTNLVPIEYLAGKRCYSGHSTFIDYESNVINAHVMRVSKLMCVDCQRVFDVPLVKEDT